MELNFSSEAPQQKNFIKKAGRGIGNAAKKVLPVAQRVLPVAAIVDAIPARR